MNRRLYLFGNKRTMIIAKFRSETVLRNYWIVYMAIYGDPSDRRKPNVLVSGVSTVSRHLSRGEIYFKQVPLNSPLHHDAK